MHCVKELLWEYALHACAKDLAVDYNCFLLSNPELYNRESFRTLPNIPIENIQSVVCGSVRLLRRGGCKRS